MSKQNKLLILILTVGAFGIINTGDGGYRDITLHC